MKILFSALIAIFVFGASALAQEISHCPALSIEQPDLTKPGELMPFKVEIKNGSSNLGYKWSVSAGTIAEGQGAPVIKVATTREMDNQNVTATVEVIGLPKNCLNIASQTGGVSTGIADLRPIDEYGRISSQDEKARLHIVADELKNYKDWKAVF